jgi:predicted dehydrogenase
VPTDYHPDCALKAIAAGRHVLVEKPIAKSLEEAGAVVKAADKAGVVLMVGQVVRYFPEFRKGHDLVAGGAVGKPAAARVRRGGGVPRAEWFLDHSRSGGVLVDLAVHDFDWLRWTLGEVDYLYARSVGSSTMKGPDYALTTLSFDSGAVAHVESTWMDPSGFRVTFEVCGSEGMIEFDSRNTPALRTHTAGGTRTENPLAAVDDPYRNQLKDFVAACRREIAPPVTGYDGFMAVSIALAALESAKTGQTVRPAREL